MKARIIGTIIVIIVIAVIFFVKESTETVPSPIAPLNSSDSDFKNLKINP